MNALVECPDCSPSTDPFLKDEFAIKIVVLCCMLLLLLFIMDKKHLYVHTMESAYTNN